MRANPLIATSCVAAALLLFTGCSSTRQGGQVADSAKAEHDANTRKGPKKTHEDHWLDTDRIEAAVDNQVKAWGEDPQAFRKHVDDLYELQRRADVLMELGSDLRALATRVTNSLPQGPFPIADLPKYFPPKGGRSSIGLVVVVMDGPVPVVEGEPSRPEVLRRIDAMLRKSGVKRRVYESFVDSRCFKLDSAELVE